MNSATNEETVANYLRSSVRLDALEKMTTALDKELADSQKSLSEIKALFDSLSSQTGSSDGALLPEDLTKFLQSSVPNLLLPDMNECSTNDFDLDNVIASMKGYVQGVKKNFTTITTEAQAESSTKEFQSFELEQYASTLDHLGKRLANIKLNQREDINNRNVELEDKLTQLCQDVKMFTQIVEARMVMNEPNFTKLEDNHSSYYDNIINQLLTKINEVSYLLQNKN